MLLQFRFRNYRSFRDEAVLLLTATKCTEYAHHVREVCGEKALPVACVYGANASGKSNVYRAFEFMCLYVLYSFAYGNENKRRPNDVRLTLEPFRFDKSSPYTDSTFEVIFSDTSEKGAERLYQYGFSVNQTGITEEWLNSKAKTANAFKPLFTRINQKIETFRGIPMKSKENLEIALENETLAVSLGAKLRIDAMKRVYGWFAKHEFVDYGNPAENLILSSILPAGFDTDEAVQSSMLRYLASFDDSIKRFRVERVRRDSVEMEVFAVEAGHSTPGSDELSYIPLQEESSGTLKMFSLYSPLTSALANGGALFMDELNARLHPHLVRAFIQVFINPETTPRHAQLLLTTHDATQLSSNLFRRDEIWFTRKDASGASELYALAEFEDENGDKVRKDVNIEKNYIAGRYGAIPDIKTIVQSVGEPV
jgi:AAA15 family ATPase/GTPase